MLRCYAWRQLLHSRGVRYRPSVCTKPAQSTRHRGRSWKDAADLVGDIVVNDKAEVKATADGSDGASAVNDVRDVLVELGIGERNAIERIEQAMDYWQERCPERTSSALCLDHVSSVLAFLAEAGIPVRSLSTIVQRCPALLMASINDDLVPMFALFDELQIRGTPRTSICVSEPRLLLEGQKDVIRHIVMSLRRLGIHESRVHRLIGECPLILMESIESFNEALIRLSCLFASEEDLILSIDTCPHLILDSELRFNEVHRALKMIQMTQEEVLQCVQREPRLLIKDPKRFKRICAWFIESGLTILETKSILQSCPLLLIRRLSMLKAKTKFLTIVAKRPIGDILSYPYYFHYSIDRTIGPRFTFLKERANAALHQAPLESLVRPSDSDFARKIAKVIEEEYVVYQTQWTHMYGHKFDFLGRPRQQQNTIS